MALDEWEGWLVMFNFQQIYKQGWMMGMHANGNITHIFTLGYTCTYDNSIIEILRKARHAQHQKDKTTLFKENWLPPMI